MIDTTKEYILLAAVKRLVPREGAPYHEGENDILKIELGYRHHDIYERFKGELGLGPNDQGFYTSRGRFVDRKEGMKIAMECGQVSKENGHMSFLSDIEVNTIGEKPKIDSNDIRPLFSEDLY